MPPRDIFNRPAETRRLVICTGPCCNKTGDAQAYLDGLRQMLVAARLDEHMVGHGSCVQRACLGKCSGEPLAYVEPDGIWYHQLSSANLFAIVEEHVMKQRTVPHLVLEVDDEQT